MATLPYQNLFQRTNKRVNWKNLIHEAATKNWTYLLNIFQHSKKPHLGSRLVDITIFMTIAWKNFRNVSALYTEDILFCTVIRLPSIDFAFQKCLAGSIFSQFNTFSKMSLFLGNERWQPYYTRTCFRGRNGISWKNLIHENAIKNWRANHLPIPAADCFWTFEKSQGKSDKYFRFTIQSNEKRERKKRRKKY